MPAKRPTASTIFPRSFILNLYTQALEHGHILVHPIDEAAAKSLTMQFYRLRRTSDRANSHFILPQFTLVTVGKWSPDNGGTLPIYYTSTDMDMPQVTDVAGNPLVTPEPQPILPVQSGHLTNTSPIEIEEIDETDFDVDDYVAGLLADAHKRKGHD